MESRVSALAISLIALALIFGGTFLGVFLRRALPESHLVDEAKDVVRLGTGLIGTIAALVLSLLVSTAHSSYNTQIGEVRRLTASIVLLHQILAQYGPETHEARAQLRQAIGPWVRGIWREHASEDTPFGATGAAEATYAKVAELSPQTEAQHLLKARAIDISTDLAQTRLLLFFQAASSIPKPFLAVLVFWLTMIFTSFSLFSRLNPTLLVVLFVIALSASAAIYLILDLSQPFAGLMQVSKEPLLNALGPL
jgi:hypothetical protein